MKFGSCRISVRRSGMPVLVVAVLLLAGCGADDPEPWASGRGIAELPGDEAACTVDFISTGVRVGARSGGQEADIGTHITRDSRGRYYTSSMYGGEYLVWDADGRLLGSVGSQGYGPGEIAPGQFQIHIAEGDTVHVRDARAWSVFDSSGTFVRRMNARHIGAQRTATHVLGDGLVLSTVLSAGGDQLHYFHVAGTDGTLKRSFGVVTDPSAAQSGRASHSRVSAPTLNGTFWVAPPRDTGEYELEEWTLDGNRVRTIRRVPSWFRVAATTAGPSRPAPSPAVHALHVDSAGLLFVHLTVPNRRFRWPDPNSGEVPSSDMIDLYVEVIDPNVPAVVASRRVTADEVPHSYFPASRRGAAMREDVQGFISFGIVDARIGSAGVRQRPDCVRYQ